MANRKRFWVFTFARYYPSGGLNDLSCTQDTLEEAIAFIDQYEPQGFAPMPTCGHVLDIHSGDVVATWDNDTGWDFTT